MRELGPAQIHLWQYPIDEPADAPRLVRAIALLDDTERRRHAAFHIEKPRTEYALSHAILRLALSEYASVSPQDWRFVAGPWGKPEIVSPALQTPLWFNLAHTNGFTACAVGRDRDLGVDVENVNRTTSYQDLARRFFAPQEYEYLENLPLGLQREAFFRIWTLKEAYIKAEGKGLSIPLNSFHFRFLASGEAELAFPTSGPSNPGEWCFFEYQPTLTHRVAVAAKNAAPAALQVHCYDAALLFYD